MAEPTTAQEESSARSLGRPRPQTVALCIVLVAVLAYSNTFQAPLRFDDTREIVHNPWLQDLRHLGNLWGGMPTRFVPRLTFALNRAVHGLNVWGFHVVNLAIHMAAALLVWRLAQLLFRSPALRTSPLAEVGPWIAAFSGLVFVAHPLQTQAVTYIVQRDASLAAFFYLAALVCYLEARSPGRTEVNRSARAGWYAGALGCTLLGVFTKATVLTLPGAVLLLEICFFPADWRRAWRRVLPFALVVALLPATLLRPSLNLSNGLNVTKMTEQADSVSRAVRSISRTEYCLAQSRVVVQYLQLLVLPYGQSIEHGVDRPVELGQPRTLAAIAILLATLGVGLWLYPRSRLLAFSIFWFFLTLSIESSVFPLPDLMVEHRLYLPMVGFALFLPAAVFEIFFSGCFTRAEQTPGPNGSAMNAVPLTPSGAADAGSSSETPQH